MRIALLASSFYPNIGGVEELVRQLALELQRQGDEVIVVTNRWPRSLAARETYENIALYRLPFRVPYGGARAATTYALSHRLVRRQLVSILRRHGTQVLHVQCVSSNAWYGLHAQQALKLPLIVTTQGERTMDANRLFQTSPFMNDVLHACLEQADAVTACSQATLDDLLAYHGPNLQVKSQVVYNGIRLDDFVTRSPYSHPQPFVLGMGRLVPQKGFDVLIRAFASVDSSHDLLLAGDGPEMDSLKQLVAALNLQNRVHLLGRADRATAVSLYQAASLFALPSRQEPQGIVNLEAMAAGRAVVASHVGGVAEIVKNGVTGVLVEPENAEALAAALTRLIRNPDERERMGQAASEEAQRYDWSHIASQYKAVYKGILNRYASGPRAPG